MLNVFITIDTEIWCDDWANVDSQFPSAFRSYVYGDTRHGQYALPMTLKLLAEHGLQATFFVEPLFALRFGLEYLREIVTLVHQGGQHVELHMHPEWVDESHTPLVPIHGPKRQYMSQFSRAEQSVLIAAGHALLGEAGAQNVSTFRAGSYGANRDTLRALRDNGILIDSSYNACMGGLSSGIGNGSVCWQPLAAEGVTEYPITVFHDMPGHLRPAQVGATSFAEMRRLLWAALEARIDSVVIVSHSFEMLSPARNRVDKVVARRFRLLCEFLQRHRDVFNTRSFASLSNAPDAAAAGPPPSTGVWLTAGRMMEQAVRVAFR